MADIGAVSIVSEITKTEGTGPYTPIQSRARAAKFAEFFSPGDTFGYFVEDGGGLAEYGQGTLNLDGTISRTSIYWTSVGGIGGGPIDWFPGQKYISVVIIIGGGGGQVSFPEVIRGFWDGIVDPSARIERFIFTRSSTLPAGLPASFATCDVPPLSGATDFLLMEDGSHLLREDLGKFILTEGGSSAVFSLQKNGTQIGTMTFGTGTATATGFFLLENGTDHLLLEDGTSKFIATVGSSGAGTTFVFPTTTTFVPGDKFEIIGPASADPDLADLAWAFQLS
jgi:hypothetical protein